MGLAERLRKIMEKEYEIRTDSDLLKAMEESQQLDLGIFVSPVTATEELSHAV